MTIKYADGRKVHAVLLSRTEDTLRVVVEDVEDTLELLNINGTWISPDCEAVTVEFAWQRRPHKPTATEAECVCPHDLAAKLIHSLLTGGEEQSQPLEAMLEAHEALAPRLLC
jgi:hypothetical protein